MKHLVRIFIACLVCFLLKVSLLAGPAAAQVKLNYSMFFPAQHAHTIAVNEWAKEIEKRTNGKVVITVFPGGTLTPADQAYDGVVRGVSDFALCVFGYSRGRFPLSEVIDLPLGYKSGLQATRLINEFYEKFKPKEFDNVKPMYFHAHGPGIIHTKKPVNKLEDLKGMKLRCGGLITKTVIALGATPVSMTQGEAYDALSRGVVDGAIAPYEVLYGYKQGEVVKYTTECWGVGYTSGFVVAMNKEKWNSLPPDIQKIIEQVNKEWIDKTGKVWDGIDKQGKDFAIKLGNKIITLSDAENKRWADKIRPILDEYVKVTNAKGLPGTEAMKFCLDRLKTLQK